MVTSSLSGTKRINRPLSGILLAVALFATACGSSSNEPQPWIVGGFQDLIEEAITEAEPGGASEAQLELLQRAQSEGSMSTEVARLGVFNAAECLEDLGGQVQVNETTTTAGLVLPSYVVGFPEAMGWEQTDPIVAECDAREYRWIGRVYESQPSSRELLGVFVESREGILRECLEKLGVTTEPNASGWDLAYQALDTEGDTGSGMRCLSEAGIDSL